ncbi:Sec63 Brl domain-domain-containing protein [Naematelia encephala]|uniref:Sec63 Brl domain-domain-containing protein n=1 Tax=Naematelia encephala TaxID=71784 RepID=A0A1Y2B1J7_9TREE|nr:Sec63 Brl domain-domain-containing protein [Naematelia encephala]
MPGISYDDSGSLASYFGVTFLAVILLPVTWFVCKPPKHDPLQSLCHCSECRTNARRLEKYRSNDRRRRLTRRILPLMAAWTLFAYLCYTIARAPRISGQTVYNPFEILGLIESSTEKQIKKHYKKLSLQFHPDKIKLSENQTKEDADAKFVELTKAYKSLTDEVTRENLAKYGNPDGPQQREEKIAIPQWVVEGKNSIWVLAAYGLVLGGGIPFVVGRWWFAQRRLTRDGILNPTAELFFHQIRDDTDFVSLVTLLASALELNAILGNKKKAGKKERKERQSKLEGLEKEVERRRIEFGVEESPIMKKDSRVTVTTAVARRAKALLWAHMLRIDLDDAEFQLELESVLRATPPLINAMLNIALAHNWLNTSLLVTKLQPSLAQGLPANASPLAQLPGISPEQAIELEIVKSLEGRRWLEKWVKTDSDSVSTEAKEVAKRWPQLEITHAEFKVVGEKVVSPSSIVQLLFQCRYVYATTSTTKAKPALPNGHSEQNGHAIDADSVADVEDAVIKVEADGDAKERDVDIKEKVREVKEAIVEAVEEKEIGRKGKKDEKKVWTPNGYAHAPRWPALRKPHFHVLLGDSKLDKVIVQPTKITDIPLPRADGLPSEPREYSLQFQAPPQANLYSFVLYATSDTFLGGDVIRPIMLKVEDPPPDSVSDDEEDISDPEEDTLAGQMAMMRGGKVKPSAIHDGEEESSEGEYESSSDEDTPKRGKAINEDSDSDSD